MALVGAMAAGDAAAADDMIEFGKETLQVNLGYYRPNYSTAFKATASGSTGGSRDISGENDLGLDKSLGIIRLDGHWRFADRHRMFFGYYNLDRSSSVVLKNNTGPVQIPSLGVNDSILAGSSLNTKANWDLYLLGYGYSFYKTETVELAGKFGLTVARINSSISGTLNTANNGVLPFGSIGSGTSVTAPLPTIGVSGDWGLSDRWRLKASLGGFRSKEDDVTAKVTEASVAAEYRLLRNFGVGTGYNLLRLTRDVSKSTGSSSLDWRTGGWQVYGSLMF